MLASAGFVVFAYLLGSLSTAIILCRLLGLPDPRTEGSRNPGATNVLRIGGKKAAAVTLLGDALKGLAPVLAAKAWGVSDPVLAGVGLAAFLGHLFPVFFRFQGGKGVATWLGVLFGMSWPVGLAAVATWLAMAAVFRISSLSALTAALLTPFYASWITATPSFIVVLAVIAAMLFWRHRGNIQRILSGTESRIGENRRA
jgi:glycerol-3-phosphate acyltransferase PlsY